MRDTAKGTRLAAVSMVKLLLLAFHTECLTIYSPASEPLLRKTLSLSFLGPAARSILNLEEEPLMMLSGGTALPRSTKPLPFITGPEHPEALTQQLQQPYFVFHRSQCCHPGERLSISGSVKEPCMTYEVYLEPRNAFPVV